MMVRPIQIRSNGEALRRIASAQGWVIDIDGCLVRTAQPGGAGGTPIQGAREFLQWLREQGRDVVICTNASLRPAEEYAAHLRSLGFDVADGELMTSATAAAAHIAAQHPGATVLAVGGEGLDTALLLIRAPIGPFQSRHNEAT